MRSWDQSQDSSSPSQSPGLWGRRASHFLSWLPDHSSLIKNVFFKLFPMKRGRRPCVVFTFRSTCALVYVSRVVCQSCNAYVSPYIWRDEDWLSVPQWLAAATATWPDVEHDQPSLIPGIQTHSRIQKMPKYENVAALEILSCWMSLTVSRSVQLWAEKISRE